MVRKWPSDEYVNDYEALTDVTVQTHKDDIITFQDRKFTFSFPKG
jgi:hypothetical protein